MVREKLVWHLFRHLFRRQLSQYSCGTFFGTYFAGSYLNIRVAPISVALKDGDMVIDGSTMDLAYFMQLFKPVDK